jgi:hypothetical protein
MINCVARADPEARTAAMQPSQMPHNPRLLELI